MCGRYDSVKVPPWFDDWEPKYNIAPRTIQKTILDMESKIVEDGLWWFAPNGFDSSRVTAFNARVESYLEKPYFKNAERVVVVATGWKEFKGKAGSKRAFRFHRDGEMFYFGAISTRTEKMGRSFAIVTMPPSPLVATVHDRMPIVLSEEQAHFWISKGEYPDKGPQLRVFETSSFGNSVKHSGPECIEPLRQKSLF